MIRNRLVFFDFDGVLVDSVEVKTNAFVALYEPFGDRVMEEVRAYHLANAGVSRYDKFRHWQRTLVNGPDDDATIEALAARFGDEVKKQVIAAPEIPGASDALNRLAKLWPLFVTSATPQNELQDIIAARKMNQNFTAIFGSPCSKSDAIAQCLRMHKAQAGDCVMIGDAAADYKAALANAVPFIGIVRAHEAHPFPADVEIMADLIPLADRLIRDN